MAEPASDTSPAAAEPLRVLMVCHAPWDRHLGAPKVQVELADQLRAAGHRVEKFSLEDAYAGGTPPLLERARWRAFAKHVRGYLEENAARFDVIDAHQGNVVDAKASFGFDGTLVIRSAGLTHWYAELQLEQGFSSRWPGPLGWAVRQWHRRILMDNLRATEESFEVADVILAINRAERQFIHDDLGHGTKARLVPNGIPDERCATLAELPVDAGGSATDRRIGVMATWQPRKGCRDWPAILAGLAERLPTVDVLFAGTGTGEAEVLEDLGRPPGCRLQVQPSYTVEELPAVLSSFTVGAFPSHLDGFGLAVLEQLAAGRPVVAYDSPGPRDMLSQISEDLLVPAGDTASFVDALTAVLTSSRDELSALATRAREVASRYRWSELDAEVLRAYRGEGVGVERRPTNRPQG